MKKLICCILVITCCWLCLSSCLLRNSMEDFFADWEPKSDPSIAIVSDRQDWIAFDDKEITFPQIYSYRGVLCFLNGKLYGVHSGYTCDDEEYHRLVEVYVYDTEADEVELLHSDKYSPIDGVGSDASYFFDAFFYNRNIVLHDNEKTVSINIDTRAVEYLEADAFSNFRQLYDVKRIADTSDEAYYKQLTIVKGDEERVITVDYMANRNEYVDKLRQLEEHTTLFDTIDPLEKFFQDSFVINEKIYLVCNVFDREGERNTLIFCYDYENDSFEYLYHRFTSGQPHIYVIEKE